jgi:hypothetical protein
MRGRIGRPGLVGTMVRTAAIAGTAQAVQGNVARRQQSKWAAQEQQQYAEQAAVQAQLAQLPAQQSQPAAAGGDDLLAKLQKLADLKAAGVLDDAEFAAAKAKLLNE